MSDRMDLIDNVDPRERATSGAGPGRLDLGIRQAPVDPQQQSLPEEYGRLLFQLLVVDTEYLFITWEIPPAELAAQQTRIPPAEFVTRRLIVRLHDDSAGQAGAGVQELYGDRGRWFMHHGLAGHRITASLGFACGERFYTLCTAGPVSLPRDFFIEPQSFSELSVIYSTDPDGKLILSEAEPVVDAAWPTIGLREAFQPPSPPDAPGTVPGAPAAERFAPAGTSWSGAPSSHSGAGFSSLTNIHRASGNPATGDTK